MTMPSYPAPINPSFLFKMFFFILKRKEGRGREKSNDERNSNFDQLPTNKDGVHNLGMCPKNLTGDLLVHATLNS